MLFNETVTQTEARVTGLPKGARVTLSVVALTSDAMEGEAVTVVSYTSKCLVHVCCFLANSFLHIFRPTDVILLCSSWTSFKPEPGHHLWLPHGHLASPEGLLLHHYRTPAEWHPGGDYTWAVRVQEALRRTGERSQLHCDYLHRQWRSRGSACATVQFHMWVALHLVHSLWGYNHNSKHHVGKHAII